MQLKVVGLRFKSLLAMKLLILFTVVACLQVSARGYSQAITLSLENAPLEKVFKEIKKQTGYSFVYTRAQLRNTVSVTYQVRNGQLKDVLEQCFRNQPLSFVIEGRYIVVQTKAAITQPTTSILPPVDISGKVINEEGEALAGVTITAKKSGKATSTNEKGEFSLKEVNDDDILIITSVGYFKEELPVNKQNFFLIRLRVAVGNLDETIVIGYGHTTRRFSTGSVNKVTSHDIATQPVTNPLATLQGRIPGLDVTSTSGVPGSAINIQIRGQNSINPNPAGNRGVAPLDNPLIIIDGVPFAPQNVNINLFRSLASPGDLVAYGNPYGGISPLNSINPADIESIEVLRDASEKEIYGSRGANGVIIITTKKGKVGKTNLGVNIYTGQSSSTRTMKMMNTEQYISMRREAFANYGVTPDLNPSSPGYAPELLAFDTTRYTDWKKYFLGSHANITNINLSLTGGSINTQFLIGAGYVHESYIFPGGFANKRGSANLSLTHRSSDNKLDLEFSANYSYTLNNSTGTPDVLKAFTLPPNYPALLDENDNINWEYNGVQLSGDAYANPIGYLKRKYAGKTYNLISHFQFAYELFKGLRFKTSVGYNTLSGAETSQSPRSSFDPSSIMTSAADFGTNEFKTWIIEPQLEYKNLLWKGRLQVLTGGTIQKNTNIQSQLSGLNYPDDNLLGSISSAGIKSAFENYSEYKYAAVFGRINYVLNNRYLININGRRDGSSRFGPGKKFGNFYSIGTGWIFSEAKFIKSHLKWLSYGKIRVSYGTTGNDNIGNYQYLSRWQATSNHYNGSAGYIPQNLHNDDFSWSVNKKFELGGDFGLFENKVTLGLAWFRNRSGNQLVSYVLPSQTGFTSVTANFPALVQNTGFELQLTGSVIKSRKFNWTSSVIMTIPKNKLVSFPGIENSSYANIYIVGQSLSVIKGFDYVGVNPTSGLYEFRTKNGGLTSTPASIIDYIVLGNRDKRLYGGFTNNLSYNNFQLGLFFEFADQKGPNYLKFINNGNQPGTSANQPTTVLNRWQKPDDISSIQQYDPAGNNQAAANFSNSSGAYSDASYIRMKTVSFSAALPTRLVAKLKMESCRIYMNGQNLITITGYKGNDPENKSFYAIPPLKTIVVGLNLTF